MNDPQDVPHQPDDLAEIDHAAAAWVARHDRGLTPEQQDEFFQWLAADPRHRERFSRQQRGWSQLARLAQWRPEHGPEANPDLLAPVSPRPRRQSRFMRWEFPVILAAAAAVAVSVFIHRDDRTGTRIPPVARVEEPGYRREILDDGTLVKLNRGARIEVAFRAEERTVRLLRGEAFFTVAKDYNRPFVVEAAGLRVLAVGTAFNVQLGQSDVEVLVTEGRVQLERPAHRLPDKTLLGAGELASVPLGDTPVKTKTATPEEIDRLFAWQPRMLEFAATPLGEVAAIFNRHNRVHLVVADEELRSLPIGASFRSDNVEGFVRLLERSFGIRAQKIDETIILRRAR